MLEALRTRRRLMRRLVIGLLLVIVTFIAGSWVFAHKLTGPRQRVVGPPPSAFPFPIEEVSWTTEDAQSIKGWFVPGPDSERAIVLLHGFGGSRQHMLPRAEHFRKAGYAVLLYDARACGESSGDQVTFGYRETGDLLGALDWLRQRGYRKIACLGVSQGGATILMAADRLGDVSCVIVESVFDELEHAMDNRFRYYLLVPGRFAGCLLIPLAEQRTGVRMAEVKPVEQIAKLSCPVFVISGQDDPKTLPADTQRLFEAAPQPKELWLVPGAGHGDLFSQEYQEKVSAFLNQYLN